MTAPPAPAPAPAPGPHGGDGAQLARQLGVAVTEVLDLSASLNPVAPDVGPIAARYLDRLGRYPDPAEVAEATAALADAIGVEPGRVLLTNGGSEAIALVAADAMNGAVDDPEFSLYRRHLAHVEPGAPRWRSNPHNPTGKLSAPQEVAAVWDEAFFPLATARWTSGAAEHGSVVLGSLTKVFACPGLRLGFVLAPFGDTDLVARLAARQPRWSVNGLAAALVPRLLAGADLRGWLAAVTQLRSELVSVLEAHGLSPLPSDANFVLVPDAGNLRAQLAGQGIAVRDCASFGLAGHVRMAVPSEAGLRRLACALSIARPRGGT